MNTDTFDGSQPILVSYDAIRDIEDRLNVPFDEDENRVLDGLGHFYNEYILPNMFPIIVISILFVYLLIKYILKQDREEREEIEKNEKDIEKARIRKAKRIYKSIAGREYEEDELDNVQRQYQSYPKTHEESRDNKSIRSNDAVRVSESETGNIADYISDDYLLTDTDEHSRSKSNIDISHPMHPGSSHISEANPMMSDMIAINQEGINTPFSTPSSENNKTLYTASDILFGK